MKNIVESLELDKSLKLGIVSAFISENINRNLFGEIMAVVDASSKDVESRRAIKSLVSQAFTRHTRELLFGLNKLDNMEVMNDG